MIPPKKFQRLSIDIADISEELILWTLNQLRIIHEKYISDVQVNIDVTRRIERLEMRWRSFMADAGNWMDEELARSYLQGIQSAGGGQAVGVFAASGLLIPPNPPAPITPKAADILGDFPDHHTMYGVFRAAADDALNETFLPIVRQHRDRIREIGINASDQAFISGDRFTRRQLSQDLLRRFSDEGMIGIRYSNGRQVHLDSYSEMIARTITGNANRQAHMNRMQEFGRDLVQISQHFPTSSLCEPWQARVYSISGTDNRFPPLQSAISGGLYHPNCKHTQSGYTPGASELPDEDLNTKENRRQFQLQQEQRKNERMVKKWKRREATAITDRESAKAKAKIREWQKRNRELVKGNEFLRRDFSREQI